MRCPTPEVIEKRRLDDLTERGIEKALLKGASRAYEPPNPAKRLFQIAAFYLPVEPALHVFDRL
jgi:hypothetical protein